MNEITKVLPHRYPFLMVDGIDELEPGRRVKGYKLVSASEWYMSAHAPQMPSTMIIEALAQLGAFTAIQGEGGIGFLSSLKGVEVLSEAVPGDRLELEYEVTKTKRGFVLGRAKASVCGRVVVRADEIMIYIQPGSEG
ncbi:beta-hydroxyacyl-ACP dehydratase [Paenibacillus sp. 598K]|uniref:3-hydroxyacyl-ACP dehydratase FabZ family protein n=1 Tax=Paenibacillus sp. 598K TaxID=1117987 RepID=UPI000FF9BB6C|nr:3-hydroxyacyl-ACP dehydratase FabZ family protein [Paenibacillus sp. 598K]GBF77610.1 beta-hydroxyacyl-ACP dehydratase [Paenibacillus sp. 598K]